MNNNFLIDNIIDCICLEGDGGCSSYSSEMKDKMIAFMESLRTGNSNIVTVSDWLDYLDSIGDTFSQELHSDVVSIIADEIREGNWTGNEWENHLDEIRSNIKNYIFDDTVRIAECFEIKGSRNIKNFIKNNNWSIYKL